MKHTDAYLMVQEHLGTIEGAEEVYVPYACESGSRAWGIASKDSDYDVRGIYVRPVRTYLGLYPQKDTFERTEMRSIGGEFIDADVVLWDAFKAMRLLVKLNPQIIEWLYSADIYRDELYSMRRVLRMHVQDKHLHSDALYNHYDGMAWSNYAQYIFNPTRDGTQVRTKKYLYVLRPLSVLLYIREHGIYPPLNLEMTIDDIKIDGFIQEIIKTLLAQKRIGFEADYADPDLRLNAWIESTFESLRDTFVQKSDNDTKELQTLCENALEYMLDRSRARFG